MENRSASKPSNPRCAPHNFSKRVCIVYVGQEVTKLPNGQMCQANNAKSKLAMLRNDKTRYKEIQFSTSMDSFSVKRLLKEEFEVLRTTSFCLSAVDMPGNHNCHAEGTWSGSNLKKWVQGRSCLYVIIDQGLNESETAANFSSTKSKHLVPDLTSNHTVTTKEPDFMERIQEINPQHNMDDILQLLDSVDPVSGSNLSGTERQSDWWREDFSTEAVDTEHEIGSAPMDLTEYLLEPGCSRMTGAIAESTQDSGIKDANDECLRGRSVIQILGGHGYCNGPIASGSQHNPGVFAPQQILNVNEQGAITVSASQSPLGTNFQHQQTPLQENQELSADMSNIFAGGIFSQGTSLLPLGQDPVSLQPSAMNTQLPLIQSASQTDSCLPNIPSFEISPDSDVVQGGKKFFIIYKEPGPLNSISSATALFGNTSTGLCKHNPYTLTGRVPGEPNLTPGSVKVFVIDERHTLVGRAHSQFRYTDPNEELFKEVRMFRSWVQQQRASSSPNSSSETQNAGNRPMNKAMNFLQFAIYKAAQTNAQQFARLLLNTSIGKAVFSQYRNNSCLPQDVARNKGNKELADYLEEAHQRLSQEIDRDKGVEISLEVLIEALETLLDGSVQKDSDSGGGDYQADGEGSSSSSYGYIFKPDEKTGFKGNTNVSCRAAAKAPNAPQSLTATVAQLQERFDDGASGISYTRERHTPSSNTLVQEVAVWEKKRRNAIKVIRKIAEDGKLTFWRTHYATLTGVGVIAASVLGVPFTAGLSLAGVAAGAAAAGVVAGLSLAGVAAGVAIGNALAVGSRLRRYYISQFEVKEVRKVLIEDQESSMKINELLISHFDGQAPSNAGITLDIYTSVVNTLSGHVGSLFDATEDIFNIANNLEKEIETVRKVVRESVAIRGGLQIKV